VERGTHDVLRAADGLYNLLYENLLRTDSATPTAPEPEPQLDRVPEPSLPAPVHHHH